MSDFPTEMPMTDLQDEHAPRRKRPSQTSSYSPDPEERKLVNKFEALFQKAKKHKSKYDSSWPDYYRLFRGKQWKGQRPSYRQTEVFNLCFQTIQAQVPIITDIRPKFAFLARQPSDRDFADLMNDIASADWTTYNWQMKLNEVILDGHLYGTGLSCLDFDSDKNAIIYKADDVFYFFPDPYAHSLTERCNFVCHAEPMEVARAKRTWPEKAEHIAADVTNFISPERMDLSEVKYRSPSSDQVSVEVTGYQDLSNISDVLVKTFYIYDNEIIEEEAESDDNESDEKKYIKRLKYPRGRKIVIANQMVLEDGPMQYDDGKFPYQVFLNYVVPHQFWGISEFEPLEGPQRVFNKLVSYVLDVLMLMGNPIWVVDTTSGIDTQNLTNQPGLVVEKEPGSEVRREPGVQLQPYVLTLVDQIKKWFDQIAGAQDITRGVPTGGVTAASAIEDLQNAAQTRIRQKIRNLDGYLQDFGQQYSSRVMQHYTAPRVFRLTDKDGTDKYFRMHIDHRQYEIGHPEYDETQPDRTRPIAVMQNYTNGGSLNPEMNEYELRGELDVRVNTGSSLSFDKARNEERLFRLFKAGIIDQEEVLKGMDYPNWEAVMQRMQANAQAQAAAEQQQKAVPPQAA